MRGGGFVDPNHIITIEEAERQAREHLAKLAKPPGRPVYVYRLVVEYPEGIGPDNPPRGWEPLTVAGIDGDHETQEFYWPSRLNYLSRSGAHARAAMLRGWGCTVTIERSEPVTWPR